MPKKTKREPIVNNKLTIIGATQEQYDFIERIRGRRSQARMISEIINFYRDSKNLK